MVKVLFRLFGMVVRHSASYHHSTVGQVERWHSTLKTFLRSIRAARQHCTGPFDIEAALDWINLSYNSAVSSVTKYSPSFLMNLRTINLPYDAIFAPPSSFKNYPAWVKDGLSLLGLSYEHVTKTLFLNTLSNVKRLDLRRDPLIQFSPGDPVVLIKGTVIDGIHPKAQLPCKGPYSIKKVLGNGNYELSGADAARFKAPINVDRILPLPTPRGPDIATSPVQRIVGHRFDSSASRDLGVKAGEFERLEYRIRWAGFGPGSDSFRSLPFLIDIPHMVNAYVKRHRLEIPAEFQFPEEPPDLVIIRPALSDAAKLRSHFRRRIPPSVVPVPADAPSPEPSLEASPQPTSQPPAVFSPLDPPSQSSSPLPAPAPASGPTLPPPSLPTKARYQAKGGLKGWSYLQHFSTSRGIQDRWRHESQFMDSEKSSPHFEQLRSEASSQPDSSA
eukprot:5513482-Prymnesium_polylepis.2